MVRCLAFAAACVALLVVSATPAVAETQFATADEAMSLLEKAVAAVKEDKGKAFEMFATDSSPRTFTSAAPTRRTAS